VSQLRLLGLAWEVVRRIAPTRAHPIVARRPPGNVVAALPLSVIDRSRDRVEMLIHGGAGRKLDTPLRYASATLTRAAHAIEHLPMMRRGEDPATRVDPKPGAPWGTVTLVLLTAGIAAYLFLVRRRSRSTAHARSTFEDRVPGYCLPTE
jgi:hypothetical protein